MMKIMKLIGNIKTIKNMKKIKILISHEKKLLIKNKQA